jgi:hypothetical protein
MIHTTTNMICCLLFQASLPASYWAEALHIATHLLNHLPSKAVSDPTPYFAPYGTTPSYDHLRVFGCACYPNASATGPHKLSPRSTRCLFLGYSPDQKGYHCLDLTSHRIIISRHVVFDEDVFPIAGSSPPTDLDSLLESDPSTHPSQAPRLAPWPMLLAASPPSRVAPSTPLVPHAASTHPLALLPAPRAAPSPTPAPRVALSTSPAPRAARRLWPRRRAGLASLTPPSSTTTAGALLPRRPRTRAPRRERSISPTPRRRSPPRAGHARGPGVPAPRSKPSVYHPVAIHRDPGYIH